MLERMSKFRVMTYNVHSCIGRDKKADPERIARVIEQYRPDVVALQELDLNRTLSGGTDQPQRIAEILKMDYHFYSSMKVEEGDYGNAVLSRFPIELIAAGPLPRITGGTQSTIFEKFLRAAREPRGFLWTQIRLNERTVQVVTTHLGLTNHERDKQIKFMLGKDMLGRLSADDPVIFLGDFNDTHRSHVYRHITADFRDAQEEIRDVQRMHTFFSFFPFRCLDHVFLRGKIQVSDVDVPRTPLTERASDHLPMIADVELT